MYYRKLSTAVIVRSETYDIDHQDDVSDEFYKVEYSSLLEKK